MLRKLFISTAAIALLSSGAIASDMNLTTSAKENERLYSTVAFDARDDQLLATNFLGASVYSTAGGNTDRIGEISDFVLDTSGKVAAVVVDVGGFLGIGEKPVALTYDQIELTDDPNGPEWIYVKFDKQQLESMPTFDTNSVGDGRDAEIRNQPADEDHATGKVDQSTDQTITGSSAEKSNLNANESSGMQVAEKPAPIEKRLGTEPRQQTGEPANLEGKSIREGMTAADQGELRAEDIIGATIYGANDEDIGEVGDILISGDESVKAYIVNVGGFLGIGEKPVAISAKDVEIMSSAGGDLHIFTSYTKEDLENQPEYDETAYLKQKGGSSD